MNRAIIDTLESALQTVESYKEGSGSFQISISDALQDPIGLNMAIILDKLLAKGLEPNGFDQGQGFRIYKYKEMDQR